MEISCSIRKQYFSMLYRDTIFNYLERDGVSNLCGRLQVKSNTKCLRKKIYALTFSWLGHTKDGYLDFVVTEQTLRESLR